MLRRTIAGFAALWLAGCMGLGTPTFPPSPAGLGLPPGSDPVLAAVMNARSALADPPRRIGDNPAYAARTIGQLEYITAMMPEPRFLSIAPIVSPQLALGRAEARSVLGISQDATPEAVIGALAAAAAALDRGDGPGTERALAPVAPMPAATRARLSALPFMPRANAALALTERMWDRLNAMEEL